MALAFSLLFGALGAIVLLNALANTLCLLNSRPTRHTAMKIGSAVFAFVGLSFLLAAVLVWRSVLVAVVLAAWPILLFAILRASGLITVISRLRVGE